MKNKTKIGDILKRTKIGIEIQNDEIYKRLTIRINHQGVTVRDKVKGINIGTKSQFIASSGDFILSKIDARQGAFGIVPAEGDGAVITGNFWTYKLANNKVNLDWFLHFTKSENFLDLCKRSSSGNTHRKYLNEEIFLGHELFVPDLSEQEKIVENINLCKELEQEVVSLQARVIRLVEKIHSLAFS